jgi:hypothetical protein
MIEVRQLTMISEDRPTQWEGLVGDEGSIYIRYRNGALEVYVSETSSDPLKDGARIFDKRIAGRYEGQMSTDQMKSALADVCRFGS